MKKRRQHYVWRHYLDAWATQGSIWCRREGKIFQASSSNVAHQRDFYRVRPVAERDIAIIKKLFVEQTNSFYQENAERWIQLFQLPQELEAWIEAENGLSDEMLRKLDIAKNNLEEDYHSMMESLFAPILERLKNEDYSVFQDEETIVRALLFLSMQFFRTAGMAQNAIEALKGIPNFDFDAAWGLTRTILSNNMAMEMHRRIDLMRVSFLKCPDNLGFISSDQPIINMNAVGLSKRNVAEELILFYPISPRMGILVEPRHGAREIVSRQLGPSEVLKYNHAMVEFHHDQLYSNDRSYLEF